ncbi:uncharacterized protein LOC135391764 [Ornithodoros turicata]|uniref:uncharacterized protein LOC135391764 n=1 Tax=Ornithodoros turicata TaxID=34597 RepID=UPI00313A204D
MPCVVSPLRMPTLRSSLTTTATELGMNTPIQHQPDLAPHTSGRLTTTPLPSVEETLSLRLPPYWAHDPQLWFAQADAQFCARNISSQITKYGYVLGALPADTAAEIRDIILQPPLDEPYDTLKTELIARTTMSSQRRLQQLLTNEELGDHKPTQLLRRMRALAGDATLDSTLLQELFLQRLPAEARRSLAAAGSTSLDDLAKLADRILDNSPEASATIASLGHTPRPARPDIDLSGIPAAMAAMTATLQNMNAAMANLTAMMAGISTRGRSPSPVGRQDTRRRRYSSHRHFPSPVHSEDSPFCWHHFNFGGRAQKCKPPCS